MTTKPSPQLRVTVTGYSILLYLIKLNRKWVYSVFKARITENPLSDMRTIVEHLEATQTDCVCGSLIDNCLYWTGAHYIAFLECYINHWQSGYEVLVSESSEDDETLIDIFLQLYDDEYQANLGA